MARTSFFEQLAELLRAGETVAVATIVATRGSTPREVGAKMLVRRSGAILGTVGGGCGEAQVWRTALQVIEAGLPRLEHVDLTEEISLDSAAVCGGTMEVLVEAWAPGETAPGGPTDLEVASLVAESYRRRKPVALATVVAADPESPCPIGRRAVVGRGGIVLGSLGSSHLDEWLAREAAAALEGADPGTRRRGDAGTRRGGCPHPGPLPKGEGNHRGLGSQDSGFRTQDSAPRTQDSGLSTQHSPSAVRVHLEVVQPPPRLVILGAGHIAVPLARLGKLLDFEVAVLDDRASFANRERFPEADTVLATDFAEGIRQLSIDRHSHVVLVTRGHRHDVECLRDLAFAETAYLGMIGSRRRVRAVFELLGREGVPAERLARVHAPIGLDLGAQTPAEIALSIAAEIVKVHRGGRAASLSEERGPVINKDAQDVQDGTR